MHLALIDVSSGLHKLNKGWTIPSFTFGQDSFDVYHKRLQTSTCQVWQDTFNKGGNCKFQNIKKVLVEFIEQEEAGCYLNPFDKTRRKE